jgi:hypothetical protein
MRSGPRRSRPRAPQQRRLHRQRSRASQSVEPDTLLRQDKGPLGGPFSLLVTCLRPLRPLRSLAQNGADTLELETRLRRTLWLVGRSSVQMVGRVGFEPTMGFLRQIMSLLPATNTASGPPQPHCNRAPAGAARLVRQAERWSPRRCDTTTIVRTALRWICDQAPPAAVGHSARCSACASSGGARRGGAPGASSARWHAQPAWRVRNASRIGPRR